MTTSTNNSATRLTAEEKAKWIVALKTIRAPEQVKPRDEDIKLSQQVKNDHLRLASASGQIMDAFYWINAGADINTKLNNHYETILDGLLKSPHLESTALIYLIGKGALISRIELEGHTDPKLKALESEKNIKIMLQKACSAKLSFKAMQELKEAYKHFIKEEFWIQACITAGRWPEADAWQKQLAVPYTDAQWETMVTKRFSTPFKNEYWRMSESEWQEMNELLKVMPEKHLNHFFAQVIQTDQSQVLEALIMNEYKPSEDWTLSLAPLASRSVSYLFEDQAQHEKISLVAFAKSCETPYQKLSTCLDLLESFDPVWESETATDMHPYFIHKLGVSNLLQLKAEGWNIAATDLKGHNVAHIWALSDRQERAGWPTLIKEVTELVEAKNHKGQSSIEILMKNPKTNNRKYETILAGIQKRDLARIVEREKELLQQANADNPSFSKKEPKAKARRL